MAESLSYKEAVAKGLVYPGSEEAALKLTGGGKGFASTEAYKKAFQSSYQQQKQAVESYQPQISQIQKDRDLAQQARDAYLAQERAIERNRFRWRDSQFAGASSAMNRALSQYENILGKYGASARGKGINIRYYDQNRFTSFFNTKVNELVDKRKSASDVMEKAMEKYKTATKEAVTVEKRETGAAAAARKRLTRGTAGLLAKAGGAGGMVGTGLPMLGEGTAPALGMESQLGRKVTL